MLVAEPVFIREHYWEEEKPVFANNLPYDIDDTCFFFYKHNTYKPIQPGISEKNKHMLSIVPSLESSFFFPFFFLSQISFRGILRTMSNI